MINMDDPRHARLRRIVSRAFTPRMILGFEDNVQLAAARIVDDLLERGPCDFVEHVAARLPLSIICQMMGIPDSSYAMVLHDTNVILSGIDPDIISENPDEAVGQILTAGGELAGLVTELCAARVQEPKDDLITALATANIDGEQLTSAELASFFILLVVAGNETTRNAISHALMLFTDHPEQRALLLDDPEGRLGGAVEEIVRQASPVMFMRRTLTRDYSMNGQDYHGVTRSPCSTGRPTMTRACSPTRPGSTSPAPLTRTSVAGPPDRTSAWAPTWPAGKSPSRSASCWGGCPRFTPQARLTGCCPASSTASNI